MIPSSAVPVGNGRAGQEILVSRWQAALRLLECLRPREHLQELE